MQIMGLTIARAGALAGAATIFGAIAVAGAVMAAPGEGGAMAACRTDVQTFCAGVEAGGGKKMACLLQNQAKLSAACGTAVQQRAETRAARLKGTDVAQAGGAAPNATPSPQTGAGAPAAAPDAVAPKAAGRGGRGRMAACRTDVATFCATADSGKGGRVKCLIENKAKLSADCAAAIDGQQQARAGQKAVCAQEAQTLCGSEKGAARRQCLEVNKAKLSAECATALDKRASKRAARTDAGAASAPPASGGAAAPVAPNATPAPAPAPVAPKQ